MNIIMVGYNQTLLNSFEKEETDYRFTIVEEADLYQNKKLFKKNYSIVDNIIFGEYQQSTEFIVRVEQYMQKNNIKGFDAVIPGLEYAVLAADLLAEKFGLNRSGGKAAKVLTNKLLLRHFCEENKIPQPNFLEVKTSRDIYDFYKSKPIVLKPANRQASLGVKKIYQLEEIDLSWKELMSLDEGNHLAEREMEKSYLVESCMVGTEISVEAIVSNGNMIFNNITDKQVTEGAYSVETGHLVPSLLNRIKQDQILKHMGELINALEFKYGTLHAEWIITENGPFLIECAARAPGDSIFELIKLAYNFNPYKAYLDAMIGNQTEEAINAKPTKSACIKFICPPSGVVQEISGLENLEAKDVYSRNININKGDTCNQIRSSWDRKGSFIVIGDDPKKTMERVNALMTMVKIEIV